MPYKPKSKGKARDLSRESGVDRLKGGKPKSRKPVYEEPSSSSDDEGSATDSSVQSFLDKREKDDSRRPKPKPKKKNVRDRNVRPTDAPVEADEEDIDQAKPESPPTQSDATSFVAALAYRHGYIKAGFPTKSRYIPDTSSLFTVLFYMCETLSENSLIHKFNPQYTSLAMYAYYAHVVYFHILRVIATENDLSRVERRALRTYEGIGPAEAWPIATPLIPFIQALGKVIPDGGKYGPIYPKFPNYTGLHHATERGLTHLVDVRGAARLPIMPAIQQFLHNFGTGVATFTNAQLYPTAVPALGAAPANFVGLTTSAADAGNFQTIAFSAGWKAPVETGIDTYAIIMEQKRALVRRWRVPAVGNDIDITDMETFLGLQDGQDITWIKQLMKLSTGFNKFFPGSITLDKIPPITRLESLSKIEVNMATDAEQRNGTADTWFRTRRGWKLNLTGYLIRDDVQIALQIASSTAVRMHYGTRIVPANVNIANSFSPEETGPYFEADTSPRVEINGIGQADPLEQASTLIESKMFDNCGGQSKE